MLAYVAADRGELARSRAMAEEALRLARSPGEPIRAAFATRHVGWVAHLGGDAATGERLLREAVALFRRAGCGFGAALALSDLGDIALDRGEHARAAELWRERLNLTWNAWEFSGAVERLAAIAVACGEAERAARLLGAAEALRERLGVVLGAAVAAKARAGRGGGARGAGGGGLRRGLGRGAAAVAGGGAGRGGAGGAGAPGGRRRRRRRQTYGLTPRELEVLRLVAGRPLQPADRRGALRQPPHREDATSRTCWPSSGCRRAPAAVAFAHDHGLA